MQGIIISLVIVDDGCQGRRERESGVEKPSTLWGPLVCGQRELNITLRQRVSLQSTIKLKANDGQAN